VGVVLRRRPHHGRTTDVDEFDARVRLERVEVHHHQVDRLDAMGRHVGDVGGFRRIGQQATMNPRVQRDHPVVEDGGKSGEVGHVSDRDASGGNRGGRATAAENAPPGGMQPNGQIGDTGLVEHGEQRGGHAPNVGGRKNPSSTPCTRCTFLPAPGKGYAGLGGARGFQCISSRSREPTG
jgi:hypothetical protein